MYFDMNDLSPLISAIANDRVSGASEILQRAIDVLRESLSRDPDERLHIARALCRAQPAMASIWNAALAALTDKARFEHFVERVERAPSALTRFTKQVFSEPDSTHRRPDRPLSLVTISSSTSVRRALEGLANTTPLHVACAEGRPALEGRRMAAALAQAGIAVTMFTDAAISEALDQADAVVVGADAVAPRWFTNKVGTRMLAAAAALVGVPVYVIASRDKFCAPTLAPYVMSREGGAREIWDAPPTGVVVRNPYFERVPLDLVLAFVADGGIMPANDVAEFCVSLASSTREEVVKQLAMF